MITDAIVMTVMTIAGALTIQLGLTGFASLVHPLGYRDPINDATTLLGSVISVLGGLAAIGLCCAKLFT